MRRLVLSVLFILAAAQAAAALATAPGSSNVVVSASDEDVPRGTPTDDYGFVAWCYGALDESLGIYETIKPDLKAIDALFGSPVQEDVPYAQDVAAERLALKRFQAAITAAEKASPGIAPAGVAAMAKGRMIWARAKTMSSRLQADTWLYWGVPNRCESTAQTLKLRAARPDQAALLAAEAAADLTPPVSDIAEQWRVRPEPSNPSVKAPGAAVHQGATGVDDTAIDLLPVDPRLVEEQAARTHKAHTVMPGPQP